MKQVHSLDDVCNCKARSARILINPGGSSFSDDEARSIFSPDAAAPWAIQNILLAAFHSVSRVCFCFPPYPAGKQLRLCPFFGLFVLFIFPFIFCRRFGRLYSVAGRRPRNRPLTTSLPSASPHPTHPIFPGDCPFILSLSAPRTTTTATLCRRLVALQPTKPSVPRPFFRSFPLPATLFFRWLILQPSVPSFGRRQSHRPLKTYRELCCNF